MIKLWRCQQHTQTKVFPREEFKVEYNAKSPPHERTQPQLCTRGHQIHAHLHRRKCGSGSLRRPRLGELPPGGGRWAGPEHHHPEDVRRPAGFPAAEN